ATAPGNNKPLTQISCPSSSVCYAAGDRGNVMKSTDGGQSWSWLASTDGNPIYGLACPTPSVCSATDIYAPAVQTTNGGGTWRAAGRGRGGRRGPAGRASTCPRRAGRTRSRG